MPTLALRVQTTLRADTGEFVLGELSTAVAVRGGYVATSADRTRLLYFDDFGKHVRTVGTTGSGPGEIRNLDVMTSFGTHLLVRDNELYHRFDHDGQWRGDFRLRLGCGAPVSDTTIVCTALSGASEHPLWYVNIDGTLFGELLSESSAESIPCTMCQAWALHSSSPTHLVSFVSGAFPVWENWDALRRAHQRTVRFELPPSIAGHTVTPSRTPPLYPAKTRVYGGWRDEAQRTFLVLTSPLPTRDSKAKGGEAFRQRASVDLSDFANYQSVLAAYNKDGVLLAETAVPGARLFPVASGLVSRPHYTTAGLIALQILRSTILEPSTKEQ